jgi:uncharacterized membrane protein YkoI
MRRFAIAAVTVIGSMLALSAPAWSDEKGKKDKEKEEAKVSELVKDAKVTIDQAIKTASEKVQGTVVEAELEKKHGKTVWEVEIVAADNKLTEVHIDAATGDVIDTEEKKEEKKGEKKKGKEKGK